LGLLTSSVNQRVERLFSERATRWSECAAIKIGERQVSYADLDRVSNRLARRLIQQSVGRNCIVAVATGNIEYFAVAVLGILKTGAAFLPIDTRYSVERVRDILTDAAPAMLLADAAFPTGLIPAGLPVIRDFAQNSALDAYSHLSIETAGSADDTACIYYTSGSTGRPKGIEVAHRGIPSLVEDRDFVRFGPDDRVGQASNFAFDAITFEVWGALLNGGCIVHIPKDILFSSAALAEFLELEGITIVWLTTSLFNALSSSQPGAFETLRVLVIGGEAADPVPVGRVLRSGRAPRRLVNAYGPTEATTFATWHEVTLADVDAGRVPIGKPIRNIKIYVLDESKKAVRRGEPGELFIGGPGVANGYLHQPGLTSERFVPDPFDTESSGRLYRTGDLCRELPDGNIEYLGRIDDQVKIRGFRVEPFEVAAALRRLTGVEDAVVLARTASFGTKELIAFVRGEKLPSVENLRQEMIDLVPNYMVPSIIRPIVEFPLTANGKLDRAALHAKIQSGDSGDGNGEQGNETEKRVAAIWRHVLQRDDIALDKDFGALGGDSLSIMNMAIEIEKTFGVVFSSDDLASPLTISRLAAEVHAQLDDVKPNDSTRLPGEHRTSTKVFAISYPWTMGRMPEEIGQALSAGRWQHVQVPFAYFRDASNVTIEDMAVHLARLICSMSPEGPYVLYGQCFTGLLAYEVAQQLVAAGHAVSTLVIVDSYPTVPLMSFKRVEALLRRTANFAKLDLKSQTAKLRGKLFPVRAVGSADVLNACVRASSQYRPRPYRGCVVYFRPRDLTALAVERDATAWRRLVLGEFTEHVVNLHDHGRVTAQSAQSGYNEIATKLNEMRLVQHAEVVSQIGSKREWRTGQ
jgi:amino acid adenylation domain-containing protein